MMSLLSLRHFNSIKVRLELIYALGLIGSYLFQFHKGAIRTASRYASTILPKLFQFHKGAIRTPKMIVQSLFIR